MSCESCLALRPSLTLNIYRHDGKTLLDDMLRPAKKTSWMSWMGQILKYGASVWLAPNVPDRAISKLNRLPTLETSPSYPFSTVDSLVSALNLSSEISSSGAQLLRSAGISPLYEANIILPEVQKRFKQRPEHLTGLALSMAMQETDKGSRYGGGQIIPIFHRLLDASGADIRLNSRVSGLSRQEVAPGKFQWALRIRSPDVSDRDEQYAFDKVVLATPWKSDELEINIGNETKSFLEGVPYLDEYITFFKSLSELNIDHLGHSESGPRRLLVPAQDMQEPLHGIRELAFVKDTFRIENGEVVTEHLYRVFSDRPLSNSTLEYLLGTAERVTWKHHSYVRDPDSFPFK